MKKKHWKITWGGRSWTDEDVLAGDLVSVQLLIGGSWENCEPSAGPVQLMAMIAALECRSSGRDLDEVMAEIRESPAIEVADALTVVVTESPVEVT